LAGGLYLVASGYAASAVVEERIARIAERLRTQSAQRAQDAGAT
jgi:hypothetical protein